MDVVCLGGAVTVDNPILVFFGKESRAVKHIDANVKGVLVGDGGLKRLTNVASQKKMRDEYFKPHRGVCQSVAIVVQLVSWSSAELKHLRKAAFGFIIHLCIEDETKEDAGKCGDHIDDMAVCFEFDCVQIFCRGTFVVVLAILEFGFLLRLVGNG